MIDVAEDVGLSREALGPVPFLLELIRKRIGVFQAFDVTTRARIAVPEPGPADVAAGLENSGAQSHAPKPVKDVKACKSCTHHNGIQFGGHAADLPHRHLASHWTP